jgi:LuxR family maltose regulon positive regulatory protein
LILISAPAGFGKTTLVSEWIAGGQRPAAWLSLDEGDNDPLRFLAYFITALQAIVPNIGDGVLRTLQSPQPPPAETMLTALLNEINTIPDNFVLVLDDYHVIEAQPIDTALTFLLEHTPPQMHLVITTREDPGLPLARLRARDQLTELRASDLRFTYSEAAGFLDQVMGLQLSTEDITALETRTEGWIAGLQLAALAMQGTISTLGSSDVAGFIKSFTGSHHFITDYLVEEVLRQQTASVQTFLLRTSILDRLCGPLCDALMFDGSASGHSISGQETLEYLERANLFTVPLDNERRWYRYHHLLGDLLRQRLQQSLSSSPEKNESMYEYHRRASQWYEDNGFGLEAFQHAAAANDVDRAERLSEAKGIPLHFGGAVNVILDWLGSLPKPVLDARPTLWLRYASLLLISGQTAGVEEKLQAAETALEFAGAAGKLSDDEIRNLVGPIAASRATLALTRYDVETMHAQSRRALEYLHPSSLFARSNAFWTLGYACFLQGDRSAARRAFREAISLSQASGAVFNLILATIGLGNVQEADIQLHPAAETYRLVLHLAGDQPQQIIHEAHLGLARILYEWNDLDAAEEHGRQSLHLARQYDEKVIDRFVMCEVFLARLKLAQGDAAVAAVMLAKVAQIARQRNFMHRLPEVAAAQVVVMIKQGNLAKAAHLTQAYELPLSQARVILAQGDPSSALALVESFCQKVEARGWQDERLKGLVLQAVVLQSLSETDRAEKVLAEALELAEPAGFIRIFVDEGPPMAQLISEASARGIMPDYVAELIAAFEAEVLKSEGTSSLPAAHLLVEPLSLRELEILQLIAQGMSNHEIGERLFLAESTVKGHNRNIFAKLQVQRRTEAIARARELGLL